MYIVDVILMSIDVWAKGAVFTHVGTGFHVIGADCIMGRAPRTKETLPYFRERYRVTQH